MPEPERGSDHAARIASLRAFEAVIDSNVESGLAELGALDHPARVYAAIQLLIQSKRFQDAVDLAQGHRIDCRWVDLAVYANVALKDIATARMLLEFANESCEAAWVSERCRIAVAEAVFSEVLDGTAGEAISSDGLSDEHRAFLGLSYKLCLRWWNLSVSVGERTVLPSGLQPNTLQTPTDLWDS